MQRFRKIVFLTTAERWDRAGRWPLYLPRIYFALRRAHIGISRRATWRLAWRIFHQWVWNWGDLPFGDHP